ncbi:3-hydroxyanthranilate 3,4-dioxygenase [Candidatus Kapabacteria bacterium]|nr:3-hydroxyanthranilate 3,4-dioxygenase [Candidatus Kapabacteria bacterium]
MSKLVTPLNFKKWIDEHRHLLKPPVGNQQVWEDGDFIIMVVGGPNARKDYHYNETPEFFYQLEGDMILKVKDGEEFKDIEIKEGEIFLLPPKVPHGPQRFENTVGLVVEQKREPHHIDALEWYCENCGNQLYRETFSMTNIVTELPPLMNKFMSSEELRTCNSCNSVMQIPKLPNS